MQLEDRSECVSDLGFDEWFAGEGSEEQRARFAAHVQACTRCRLRGELLDRERAAFLAKAPTLAANANLARRSRRQSRSQHGRDARVWFALSAAALFTAVGSLLWLPSGLSTTPAGAARVGAGERLKGNSQVGFYVKRGTRVQRGESGDTVYPGDRLRFTYSSEQPTYLAVFGRDRRAANAYFPSGTQAARVAGGRDQPLDFSLELDAQLGEEQLFVVLCPTDYALAPLLAELESKGELRAPAECRVEHIALRKQAPP